MHAHKDEFHAGPEDRRMHNTTRMTNQYSTTRAQHSFQKTSTTRDTQPGTPRNTMPTGPPRNASRVPTPSRGSLGAPLKHRQQPAACAEPPTIGRMRFTSNASDISARSMNMDTEPTGDRLDLVCLPGSVLCIQGGNGGGTMMRLGSSGGYMGHVLLVTSPPRPVQRHTPQAISYQNVWPTHQDIRTLWLVRTLESTRSVEGYHEADHLLYIEEGTGRILALGEDQLHNTFLKFDQPEGVDVWQCPPALQRNFRFDVMNHVLNEMKQSEGSWSWSTAVRAFFFSSAIQGSSSKANQLHDIQMCWNTDPICSSLIVEFWQRYLCALADVTPNANPQDTALKWILQCMPLRSDRALPGDLLSSMQRCEWVMVSDVPQAVAGRPRLNTWCN